MIEESHNHSKKFIDGKILCTETDEEKSSAKIENGVSPH